MTTTFDSNRRVFRVFTYRGVSLNDLQKMSLQEFSELLPSQQRRHFKRGLHPREIELVKQVILSKQKCVNPEDKPEIVNTYARTMSVVPCFVGSFIGVHNGKVFVPIEVKPEMIGSRLCDFAPCKRSKGHGRPGVGATSGSKFVPLK
ncbi:ribosomal protein S19 [Edhazardia aedis USNM 41457]|uniref:Ribosomal protein S19 n=1 Tax=Edhazardia aedis (strain USNM 41457) TaxID=1003232 RepID=J9D8U1_EDHAE|nr:ribosomal protein S19 [Edhazardia aedis USNM 41457]|eukprot:EJW04171.1 ribosomal protein S19 [Edhazardia aedis USNM 41457]